MCGFVPVRAIIEDPHSVLSDWTDVDGNACNWHGVICSAPQGSPRPWIRPCLLFRHPTLSRPSICEPSNPIQPGLPLSLSLSLPCGRSRPRAEQLESELMTRRRHLPVTAYLSHRYPVVAYQTLELLLATSHHQSPAPFSVDSPPWSLVPRRIQFDGFRRRSAAGVAPPHAKPPPFVSVLGEHLCKFISFPSLFSPHSSVALARQVADERIEQSVLSLCTPWLIASRLHRPSFTLDPINEIPNSPAFSQSKNRAKPWTLAPIPRDSGEAPPCFAAVSGLSGKPSAQTYQSRPIGDQRPAIDPIGVNRVSRGSFAEKPP
ncbi:hypothetical protein HU200_024789 [Digitaria exilis]|uniref:Leucine-rich repeat-containing N-terminal plant-type domain-containing protein n=1 Tax=Digitaria exilis TaxID=1010633 RepID=A0A835C3I1_9POAL|nr:hypothetical protein HU200_024789 [Digitaria exilis]